MSSTFLADCPQCKNLIAKNSSCPNCGFADGNLAADAAWPTVDSVSEFSHRHKTHLRNSNISMLMKLAGGVIALATSVAWFQFVFMGSIFAFIAICLLTPMSAIFGWVIIKIDQFFPEALKCPGCNERLDQLNMSYDNCPGCNTQLT